MSANAAQLINFESYTTTTAAYFEKRLTLCTRGDSRSPRDLMPQLER